MHTEEIPMLLNGPVPLWCLALTPPLFDSPLQADIWACAVLLYVSLFGMFPYDHPQNPDPNTELAHSEVR